MILKLIRSSLIETPFISLENNIYIYIYSCTPPPPPHRLLAYLPGFVRLILWERRGLAETLAFAETLGLAVVPVFLELSEFDVCAPVMAPLRRELDRGKPFLRGSCTSMRRAHCRGARSEIQVKSEMN